MSISQDTFDVTKQYKRVRFHEDRDLLDSELNELQEIAIHERHTLLDHVFVQGAILSGLAATPNDDQVAFAAGEIYVDGHVVAVSATTLTFEGAGVHSVWLDVFWRDITAAVDPILVNPLTGEPTAEREQWVASLQTRDTSGDPLPDGARGRTVVEVMEYDRDAGTVTALCVPPPAGGISQALDDLATTPPAHTHDDRYYTEAEADILLAGKSGVDHHHNAAYAPIGHVGAGATAHAAATTEAAGFMAAADKSKLDGIPSGGVPAGAVMPFAMDTVPTGWLECDGSAVSRATYAALFSAIGTTFGAGNGTTTFNLPDLRGEFVRGWDHGRGIDTGRNIGTAQADALKDHTHNIPDVDTAGTTTGKFVYGDEGVDAEPESVNITGGVTTGSATETRPRNIALMYCIKH
jgi:microcystin-dependent protein